MNSARSPKFRSSIDSLAEPKQIHWVQGADHFFAGKLDEVQEALRQFLTPIVSDIRTT